MRRTRDHRYKIRLTSHEGNMEENRKHVINSKPMVGREVFARIFQSDVGEKHPPCAPSWPDQARLPRSRALDQNLCETERSGPRFPTALSGGRAYLEFQAANGSTSGCDRSQAETRDVHTCTLVR